MDSDRAWLPQAAAIVALVTLWRVLALAFSQAELFVDESQYWLWGQAPAFGYYSKPPLIAWVIRASTELGGSDAAFWIRLPGPLFHAATALVLGRLAFEIRDGAAARWTAALYITLPFASLGSALISTDTILAPFYAAALLFWLRLGRGGGGADAALAGAMAGLAFLAKYAAVYLIPGALLAAALVPALRVRPRHAGLALAVFLAVIAPNLAWNLQNGLATVEHTIDNIGWIRGLQRLDVLGPPRFLLEQFAVFGPLLFPVLILRLVAPRGPAERSLVAFALPPLAAVTVQALLSETYANWGLAAYFAGTPLVVLALTARPGWLRASLALHLALALAVPLAAILAPTLGPADRPLLSRYLGRVALSEAAIAAARSAGFDTVAAANRDVLADLFHTGRDSGLHFRALPPSGRPRHYYEQMFPLEPGRPALAVLARPPVCDGVTVAPLLPLEGTGGAYAGRNYAAYPLRGSCRYD